tara:strand:- start:156 stop:764 length:609 start_codon:yes stop_codon:yes gene_type:complete
MSLDHRLLNAALELIRNESPREVNIEELYNYVDHNVVLTKQQLQLHSQIAGQEEENWMHDLRNLLSKAKSNGELINPTRNHWTLPRKNKSIIIDAEKCFDIMVKRASLAVRNKENFSCNRSGFDFFIKRYSSENIEVWRTNSDKKYNLNKGMVISKIEHLINCGGELEIGMLHKWSVIESAIIILCVKIRITESNLIRIDAV